MLLRKHQQQPRGLSHEQKVKKLQKLTRVPLANLKTNIAQSDFEEDDMDVPFSMRNNQKKSQELNKKGTQKCAKESSKNKQYNQQKVNKMIKAMTTQLYCLSFENQPIIQKKQQINLQPNISIFQVENTSFLQVKNNHYHKQKQTRMDNFYSKENTQKFQKNQELFQLRDISSKFTNLIDMNFIPLNKPLTKKQTNFKQTKYRESEPVISISQNIFQGFGENFFKKSQQSSQSYISKRFSRSKRSSQQINDLVEQKKLKFNRSNKKNAQLQNLINNENQPSTFIKKKGLLTQRVSFQAYGQARKAQINHKTTETTLHRRNNIGPKFINISKENQPIQLNNPNFQTQNEKNLDPKRINSVVDQYERISQIKLFKELQNGNCNFLKQEQSVQIFIIKILKQYRKAIQILKQFD